MKITPNMVLGYSQQKGLSIVVKLPEHTYLTVGNTIVIADKEYALSHIQGIDPNINSYALTLEAKSVLETLFQEPVTTKFFKV